MVSPELGELFLNCEIRIPIRFSASTRVSRYDVTVAEQETSAVSTVLLTNLWKAADGWLELRPHGEGGAGSGSLIFGFSEASILPQAVSTNFHCTMNQLFQRLTLASESI